MLYVKEPHGFSTIQIEVFIGNKSGLSGDWLDISFWSYVGLLPCMKFSSLSNL